MDDKLTFEDFFAVIGILAVSAILYSLYKQNENKQILASLTSQGYNNNSGYGVEYINMNSQLYTPTTELDGYMQLYDTSEGNTIGVVPVTISSN